MFRRLRRLLANFRLRFRQRLTRFQQLRGSDKAAQKCNHWLWLNDPVIEVIKRHVNMGRRIGFEPISKKFARIAFKCKRRMSLTLRDLYIFDGRPDKNFVVVHLCLAKNAVNTCLFNIPISKAKDVLHSLFLHIRKWHIIRFNRAKSHSAVADSVWDGICSQLLDAILAANSQTIDVQQFFNLCAVDEAKLADFVRRCAPNLRYLDIPLLNVGGIAQPSTSLFELAQAICTCQKLHDLWLLAASSEQFPPDFLCKILAMPQLASLLLGHSPTYLLVRTAEDGIFHVRPRRVFPHLHWFSIDHDWLLAFSRLPELSMLKKMQHCLLYNNSREVLPIAAVFSIVAQMNWPAFVSIDYNNSVAEDSWQIVWNHYLPMAYKTGADVERSLLQGLPTLTAKEFEEGLATVPPIIQNALTVPNLANAPIENNHYQKLEFSFASGAKVTFKTCFP